MIAEAEIAPRRLRSICVLGSTSSGHDPALVAAARRLGQEIALGAIRLVYGGGSSGVVGAVAKGAASCNGSVVAIPHKAQLDQSYHGVGAEQVVAVADMHIRKRLMFDYADAFIALPGGVDTVDAMAEVLALRQMKQHHKPLVLANLTGLWTPWLKLLEHIEMAGFASGGASRGFVVADDVSQVLPLLRNAMQQPDDSEWVPFEIAIEEAGGFYSPPNP
jgi:uncharacterized protein (TIGR00730 family)